MEVILRCVLLQLLVVVFFYHHFCHAVTTDQTGAEVTTEASGITSGRDIVESASENHGCRCQWLKNVRVSFEVAFSDYGDIGENATQMTFCTPQHFGIASTENAEWECYSSLIAQDQTKGRSSPPGKSINVMRTLISTPQSANVSSNDDTVLACEFSAQAPWCFWTKDDVTIAIEGRYSFIGDKEDGNCSIMIKNLTILDDGSWRCHYPKTSYQDSLQSERIELMVRVAPTPPVISVNGVPFKNGQKLYLTGILIKKNQYDYHQKQRNYGEDYVAITSDAAVSCWSLNGNPAANLRWNIRDDSELNVDRITSSRYPKLYNSRINFPFTSLDISWQQSNLTCSTDNEISSEPTSIEIIVSVLIEM